jgi:hypothetical protein
MTLAALLAVAVAADPRLAHLSFCQGDRPAALSTFAACEPDETCCPPEDASACSTLEACGCCGPASPSHQGEQDSRSTFVSPAPVKMGLAAAIFSTPLPLVRPRTLASSCFDRRSVATSTPPVYLLCQHFLT